MKKTYMNPSVEVVELDTTEVLQTISGFDTALGTDGTDGPSALGNGRDIEDMLDGIGNLW